TKYEAWPDIIKTKSGKLICIFAECEHHKKRYDTRLAMCESTDKGRSWSGKRYLNEPFKDNSFYNNPRLTRLHDDSIVILCDRVFEHEDKAARVYMWKGDEEGNVFSEPIETPAEGIVPDKLLELECGRWIISAHFKNNETKKSEQYLWYSDDKGKSWSNKIVVGADKRYNLCEASILPIENKTLVAFMRENSGMGYDCMKSISYDNGETWNGVYNVPIPGCHRPVSGKLINNKIMITHRYMQGGKGWLGNWTQNVFAAFTDIESALASERKEQSVRIFPLDFDRSPKSDLGYTGWVQFDDGEIYVVSYIVDDAPKAHIRGYSFRMEDVILEQ
ncbi:MAG: sialidase family protein, partial [Firmicutes bacterium]|nr:sialidase family protein [Bacillota bacterium]